MTRFNTSIIGLLLLLSLPTGALEGDADQPIILSADQVLRDEKRGFTVYSGNVTLVQGSLNINAELITIYSLQEEADKIIAEGSPAKFQQQQAKDQKPLHAEGGIIEYYKEEQRVQLKNNARLEQGGSIVTGDTIDYFMAEQVVKATGGSSGGDKRVNVVIPPRPKE